MGLAHRIINDTCLVISFFRTKVPKLERQEGFQLQPISKGSKSYLNVTSEEKWTMQISKEHKSRNEFWNYVWDELARIRDFESDKPALTREEVLELKKDNRVKTEL